MGIKQLYNDNLRKLPNEYGDVSAMYIFFNWIRISFKTFTVFLFFPGFFSFILTEIYYMDVYSYYMMK